MPQSWSFEIDGSAYYNHDRIVTVQFNIYSYTGGAHPNGYTAFINIAEDGTMPEITEIITDTTAVKAMLLDLMKSKNNIINDTDIS
ncbi:PdaC/SigV domain-containing protein, partial [Limnospira sp. PMC 1252.20]|uniref:PdaC/SigV domain-containing protein n=1 Tax=Limnospira sp. PMC 1252.20 TaxID=2981050 RepID=UPI0037BFD22D